MAGNTEERSSLGFLLAIVNTGKADICMDITAI